MINEYTHDVEHLCPGNKGMSTKAAWNPKCLTCNQPIAGGYAKQDLSRK
jgi:hypothetical protein